MVAAACGAFVAAMVGMSYAAVPLYSWFCRTTGFGGTPIVTKATPAQMLGRRITVRFDANIGGGLPWRFEPERTSIDVRLGEVVTVYYNVTNLAARETAGQAAYNVAPSTAGGYFDKINCFCFTEQRLARRREAGNGGRLLRRSRAREGFRPERPQYHHALLHLLSRAG